MKTKQSLRSELSTYSNQIINGEIVACQKHKWACQRFLNDIKRSEENDPEFPYCFNEEKAERFLSYCRLFKHRKGVLKGEYIKPDPIIKFIFGNIYGWYNMYTGYRRFDKAYWQVGRKNAKSQYLSIVGSYECGPIDEEGLEEFEVYVAATKTDQADIVYDGAVKMLKSSKLMSCKLKHRRFKVANGKITHIKSGSVMRTLSREDGEKGDGFNPQCGIIDEYHAHQTSEMYEILDSGMGARESPLMMIITTAGFNLAHPCYRIEYKLVTKILDPGNPTTLENYFVMINELDRNETSEDIIINGKKIPPWGLIDDIKDESVWPKANPIVCSYDLGIARLRKSLKLALEAPEKMRNFLTKNMNVWVNQRDNGYIDVARWVACGCTKSKMLPDLRGRRAIIGVDLSSTIDLTSVGFVLPFPENKYVVLGHSFMPEERVNQKMKTDKVPYELWIKQGWITKTEGAEVDYHCVLDWIEAKYEEMEWDKNEFTYDRALATWLKQEAELMDFENVIEVPQTYTHLSFATKELRAKSYAGNVIHDNNPVLNWAMGNAVTRTGPSGQILLDKGKSSERIDPVAAVVNAMTRAIVVDDGGAYGDRGLRSLG